ncbi:MAG: DALR domain-containing protein, partial [Nitrospirota bacterium]
AQLNEAIVSLDRYYSTVVRIDDFMETGHSPEDTASPSVNVNEFVTFLSSTKGKFEDAMNDDFNTALALGHIFELVRSVNRFLDSKSSGQNSVEAVSKTKIILVETGGVLNIFRKTPQEWYSALMKMKNIGLSEKDIINKISERQNAREEKDWASADKIRKELEDKGIILEDKKEKTTWKVRAG